MRYVQLFTHSDIRIDVELHRERNKITYCSYNEAGASARLSTLEDNYAIEK